MKIVFVGEAVSGFGGMETVIKSVINCFQRKDHFADCEMFFFCRNDKMDKAWLEGIPVTYSFCNNKISFIRRAKHISCLSDWLVKNDPDAVICIDVLACFLVSKAREKSGVRFPLISWPHFSLDHKKHADCIIYADYHLAISTGIKKQMLARGISPENISVVYNPVTPQPFLIPVPEKNEPATFLYIGRMKFEGQKRVKDLLDALARVTGEWRLHAIGDGSDFEKCQAYARALGIDDRVIWYGWQKDPWLVVERDIRKVSALLLTSSFEGFGMVLLEAMACGISCISSKCVAGPEDIIKEGVNGYLYRQDNLDELVALLQLYIERRVNLQPQVIKQSISHFYNDIYTKSMRGAILSAIQKSDK